MLYNKFIQFEALPLENNVITDENLCDKKLEEEYVNTETNYKRLFK